MSTVSVQQRISPPVITDAYKFSDAPVNSPEALQENGKGKDKINFKDLITDSMETVKKDRDTKKKGDLSDAKSDAEFLEKLSESSKPKREIKNNLDKDDFLKLFVTQLQHQDPLNPDDGAEMAAKLAQFNSVEQMMNVNTSLQKLLEAQNTTKNQGLIQYIGKQATLEGGKVSLKDGRVESVPYSTAQDAAGVTLQVYDQSGNIVSEKELGMIRKGVHKLDWQGLNKANEKAPDGQYSFKLISKDSNGITSPVEIKSNATITGIDFQNPDLNIQTNLGKIKLADIKALAVAEPESVNIPAPAGIPLALAENRPNQPTVLAAAPSEGTQVGPKTGIANPAPATPQSIGTTQAKEAQSQSKVAEIKEPAKSRTPAETAANQPALKNENTPSL